MTKNMLRAILEDESWVVTVRRIDTQAPGTVVAYVDVANDADLEYVYERVQVLRDKMPVGIWLEVRP